MKALRRSIPCVFLVFCLVFGCFGAFVGVTAAEDGTLLLASGGRANYVIVCGENASEVELSAADILADYLGRISGADFEIISDTQAESECEILIGNTNRAESVQAFSGDVDYGEDGVRIAAKGEKLVLTGGSKRGALYAVYTLLEEYLGCRWFTSTLTVVPENSEPTIPASLDYSYVPCFRLRQTYWRFSTADTEFCVAHKLDSCHVAVPDALGGVNSEYNVYGVHTFESIVPAELFAEHPEYFGDDGSGVRKADMQPCLSNPAVVSRGIAWAKEFFASHPRNKVLSVSLTDCLNPCKCAECKAFDDAHGGKDSASLLAYVNTVAKAIADEYPDCYIETLAYQYAQTPPDNMSVEENVVIRLCNILTCVMHTLDDKNCPDNVRYDADMSGWAALTDNIYIWNYATDFECLYKLHPNLKTLQARFRYFRENNVIGVFDQGIGEDIVPAELHDLRTYLSAKLLWNPDTDVERHISEFCNAYYGEAGADVVKFIGLFEEYARGNDMQHLGCYGGGTTTRRNTSFSNKDIRALNMLMDKINAHELTDEQAHNVVGFKLSWRFFKCVVNKDEFNWFNIFKNPVKASRALYRDLGDYGVKYLSESGRVPVGSEHEPNFTKAPLFWFTDTSKGSLRTVLWLTIASALLFAAALLALICRKNELSLILLLLAACADYVPLYLVFTHFWLEWLYGIISGLLMVICGCFAVLAYRAVKRDKATKKGGAVSWLIGSASIAAPFFALVVFLNNILHIGADKAILCSMVLSALYIVINCIIVIVIKCKKTVKEGNL